MRTAILLGVRSRLTENLLGGNLVVLGNLGDDRVESAAGLSGDRAAREEAKGPSVLALGTTSKEEERQAHRRAEYASATILCLAM